MSDYPVQDATQQAQIGLKQDHVAYHKLVAHPLAKQANEVGKGGKSDGLQVDNVDALIDAVRGRKLK